MMMNMMMLMMITTVFTNTNNIYHKLQSICVNIRYKKTIDTNDTCLAWSAKEAIYKLYEIGGLDFKNDILIQKINKEKKIINVKFKNKSLFLNYQKINNHFLVYVCN